MATARKIQIDPLLKPVYSVDHLTPESAKKASELLQKNHEKYHIFFNSSGFHNHIVHHLLSVYALGSIPSEIQRSFSENASYQRPLGSFNEPKVQEMLTSKDSFTAHLGPRDHYTDFLEFFKREIEAKTWQAVLQEYLWAGTPLAEDMLVRLMGGFLHPLIHLGFGIEFAQPAIIAEALAQAAVHDNWIGTFLHAAEEAATQRGQPTKSLDAIRQSMLASPRLSNSVRRSDANNIRDGILVRAPDEMIAAAAQYVVQTPDLLPLKTAEMMNFCAYFTGAAQKPPHEPKIDFFYMHCINAAIFFPTFVRAEYIPASARVRLLEWKGRMDLALYGSQAFAKLEMNEIESFVPRDNSQKESYWPDWIDQINRLHDDDGHAAKLIRAIAATKQTFLPGQAGEGKEASHGFVLGEMALDKMAQMVVHSVNLPGATWVRGAGFEDAWKDVPVNEARRLEIEGGAIASRLS